MSVDDLINSAFKDRGGYIEGTNLFALVGSIETKETFVLNLQEFFFENFSHFLRGEDPKSILIGAYHTEDAARSAIDTIKEERHHGSGLVFAPELFVLMANVQKNTLYSMTLMDYYVGGLAFFQFQIDSNIVALGIFNKEEAVEDIIEYIRHSIKPEGDV